MAHLTPQCLHPSHENENINGIKKAKIILVGDSILNNITGCGLSKRQPKTVLVEKFSGATSSDILNQSEEHLQKKRKETLVVNINCQFRDRTLSMQEGGRRVFVELMKYFRHILMGHEIFFKIFDGPQNIFLCSVFVSLFFKLKGLQHKISKLAIKEIQ